MKGIVFNILENFTDERFGEDEFNKIVIDSDLETKDPFVGPGTYPDSDLFKIVTKIVNVKSLKIDWALREFGLYLFPNLIKINPEYAKESKNLFDFLLRVDSIIHIEVKKLYLDAVTPTFIFSDVTTNSMKVKYISNRNLCFLMEGLLQGASKYFQEEIELKQLSCHHQTGDDHCLFLITKV